MGNQQSKIQITLKKKMLFIFLPLIVLSVMSSCVFLYTIARKTILNRTSEYMQQYLKQLALSVDNELHTTIRINAQLAVNEQVIDTLNNYEKSDIQKRNEYQENMSHVFATLISVYDNIQGIYLFDNYDNEFYAKKRYGQDIAEVSQMDWYQDALEREGDFVIFLDEKSGADSRNPDMAIGIARSIIDIYTKESYGIVLIEIPYSILESNVFAEEHKLNMEQGDIRIQDTEGKLIYTTILEDEYWNREETELETSEESQIQVTEVAGEDVIQVKCTSQKSNWEYIYRCKVQYLMQDMENMIKVIAIFVVIMVIVIGFITIGFAELFLRPLKQLVSGMQKVADGNYEVRVQSHTKDELNYLIQTFNNMAENIRELIKKVYQAELLQKEAQLEVLHQQINPHFLYNTLESMRGLALEENCYKVADMAKNVSCFMRYNLHYEKMIVLKEEKRHVEHYIRIMNYRFENKITLKTQLPEEMLRLLVPKFILQPVVENAVLHGFSEKKKDCVIIISGHIEGTDAVIEVSDNGSGIQKATLEQIHESLCRDVEEQKIPPQKQSVGIYNVNSRLKLNFGSQYGLSFHSVAGNGTTVKVTFPIKNEMGEEK